MGIARGSCTNNQPFLTAGFVVFNGKFVSINVLLCILYFFPNIGKDDGSRDFVFRVLGEGDADCVANSRKKQSPDAGG